MANTTQDNLAPIVAATLASECHGAEIRSGLCSDCGDRAVFVPVWLIAESCSDHKHIHSVSIEVLNEARN